MNRKLILGACAVALAAVFIVGPTVLADLQGKSTTSSNAADAKKTVSTSDTVYSVRVEKVVKKNLRSYIDVNGDIVAQISVAVVPDAAGKLVTLKVEVGSVVKKGQLIAEVDPSKPGIAYSLSPIYAPISGTVSSAPLSVGATVSTSTTVAVVGVMDKLEVEAKIPERDVGQLRNGLEAQLSLEAFPGEKFAAVVDRMSP
ncbi:MAG: HlyD family efflux transporter periplasmic adaptor subunit, partial [Treponemataceae bacterium]